MPRPKTYRAALSEQLRGEFDRLVELLGTSPRPLLATYAIGASIRTIKNQTGGYGSTWAAKLSQGLAEAGRPLSPSLVYRLFKFVQVFAPDEIETFEGKLSWEGLLRVLAVKDGDRAAILKRILTRKKAPSSREVQRLIRQRTAYRRPRGGAKRPGPSRHPNDALRALGTIADGWPGVNAAWTAEGNSALAQVERMEASRLSPAFLSELERLAGAVGVLAREARELAKKLGPLAQALRKRAEAAAREAPQHTAPAARRKR